MMNGHKCLKISITVLLLVGLLFSVRSNAAAQPVEWISYEKALAESEQNEGRNLLLFMEADWCSICKEMKREVFPDERVHTYLNEHFYPVRIDIESGEKIRHQGEELTKKAFSQQMELVATPTFLFLRPDESVIGSISGYLDIQDFRKLLEFIEEENYKQLTFEEYRDQ